MSLFCETKDGLLTRQQWYAKLQAYAGKLVWGFKLISTQLGITGQRLNDTTIKQAAWDILNSNTVGVWAPVATIDGTDVVNPVKEVGNFDMIRRDYKPHFRFQMSRPTTPLNFPYLSMRSWQSHQSLRRIPLLRKNGIDLLWLARRAVKKPSRKILNRSRRLCGESFCVSEGP